MAPVQVYEARLKTGEDVVIKVRKPGVAEVLKTDLGFMYITSKLVEVKRSLVLGRRPFGLFSSCEGVGSLHSSTFCCHQTMHIDIVRCWRVTCVSAVPGDCATEQRLDGY